MERKIGEIFEYNSEWYQCVIGCWCDDCAFSNDNCEEREKITLKNKLTKEEITGLCSSKLRYDSKSVIFKKLEKIGKPYNVGKRVFQLYEAFVKPYICNAEVLTINTLEDFYVSIEIKQAKEDMEENKLIELLSEKVHNAWMKEKEAQGFSYGKEYDKEKKKHPDMLPYNELKEEVKEYDRVTVKAVLQAQKELNVDVNKLNLKPFSLEAAKAGKLVCTRDGRKARIICFDRNSNKPIVALITTNDKEYLTEYYCDGRISHNSLENNDLMMFPKKKEGWVNVYKRTNEHICENECIIYTGLTVYKSEDEAKRNINQNAMYFNTIKINWEE